MLVAPDWRPAAATGPRLRACLRVPGAARRTRRRLASASRAAPSWPADRHRGAEARLGAVRRPRRLDGAGRWRRPRGGAGRAPLYHERAQTEIERFGATVEKFIGDAVVAVFGAPVAHGDDAERAVRAGLRVLEAVGELSAEHGSRCEARAAVNTGEALVTVSARPELGEAFATGDVINTAARLQGAAPPGRLIVGRETYRATRRAIRYEAVEAIDAKGKRDPVEAWLAVGGGGDAERHVPATPLVGRDRELELLRSIWRSTVDERRPHLVTIIGEPGMGKSRITASFMAVVEGDGGRHVSGRCLPYEEQTGYRASADQIKIVAGILDTDEPAARAREARRGGRPAPSRRTRRTTWLDTSRCCSASERTSRRRAGSRCSSRSGDSSRRWRSERPTVLDVRGPPLGGREPARAPRSPRDARARCPPGVRRARAARVQRRPIRRSATDRSRRRRSPCRPLASDAAVQLARSTLGDLPRRRYSGSSRSPRATRCSSKSSPRRWATAPTSRASLPATVREAIASRIDLLPSDQRAALLDASVIGKTFWARLLGSIGEHHDLDAALDALEMRDLIRRAPRSTVEGDTQYSFSTSSSGRSPTARSRARSGASGIWPSRSTSRTRSATVCTTSHGRSRITGARPARREGARVPPHRSGRRDGPVGERGGDQALRGGGRPREPVRRGPRAIDPVAARGEPGRAFAVRTSSRPSWRNLLPELSGADELDALLAGAWAANWTEDQGKAFTYADRARALAEELGDTAALAPAIASRRARASSPATSASRSRGSTVRSHSGCRTRAPPPRGAAGHRGRRATTGSATTPARRRWPAAGLRVGDAMRYQEPLLRGGGWHALTLSALGRTEEALTLLDRIVAPRERVRRASVRGRPVELLLDAYRELFLVEEARRRNEEAIELVRRHGEWGMPLLQGRIDLLLADLMQGDVGAARRGWPELWDAAINGKAWRPWNGGCRLAYVRAQIARDAEDADSTAPGTARSTRSTARGDDATEVRSRRRAPLLGEAIRHARAARGGSSRSSGPRPSSPTGWAARRRAGRRGRALTAVVQRRGDDACRRDAAHQAKDILEAWIATLTPEHAAGVRAAPEAAAVLAAG